MMRAAGLRKAPKTETEEGMVVVSQLGLASNTQGAGHTPAR